MSYLFKDPQEIIIDEMKSDFKDFFLVDKNGDLVHTQIQPYLGWAGCEVRRSYDWMDKDPHLTMERHYSGEDIDIDPQALPMDSSVKATRRPDGFDMEVMI